MKTFSAVPTARLRQLRSLDPKGKSRVREYLVQNLRRRLRPWPVGMPTSACPHVVILGVSPGNSPGPDHKGVNTSGESNYEKPTFGTPPDFGSGNDTRHYWEKVSDLCTFLVRRDDPKLSEHQALSLTGHLNLGTGRYGTAGPEAVKRDLVKWVSSLIGSKFRAKVLVCFGLTGILDKPRIKGFWNCDGGLKLNWSNPDVKESFSRSAYHFRFWNAQRADGTPMAVLMWPNHPSRHPFSGGPENPNWLKAKKQADRLLRKHGF